MASRSRQTLVHRSVWLGTVSLTAAAGTLACANLSGPRDDGDVDAPSLVWAAPDSVRVGGQATVIALGCERGKPLCLGVVRGLRWTVRDTAVAQLERRGGTSTSTPIRGRRLGQTFVIALGRSGRDSTLVRVVP